MKNSKKPHPRNYERIARKQALWLEQARARAEKAEARAEIADAEKSQLRAQLEQITKDQISAFRKIQAELYGGRA